jgi:hypothetical protein
MPAAARSLNLTTTLEALAGPACFIALPPFLQRPHPARRNPSAMVMSGRFPRKRQTMQMAHLSASPPSAAQLLCLTV